MIVYHKILLHTLTFISLVVVFYVSTYNKPQVVRYREVPSETNATHLFNLEVSYVISNNCTRNDNMKVIMIVTSFSGNTEARSAHRKAYHEDELRRLGIYRVFLLAYLKPGTSNVTQKEIVNEASRYNDIVQGNFLEDFRNLTYKHVMGIRWAVMECAGQYIIKMDDDTVVDLYSLMEVIESVKDEQFDLLGSVLAKGIPMRKTSKWLVTKEEYSSDIYPPYVSGVLYAMKYHAASEILRVAQVTKLFWIDDVFVSGVLAGKANLTHLDAAVIYTPHSNNLTSCIQKQNNCDFIIGPSNGNYSLIVDFQRYSKIFHKPKSWNTLKQLSI